MPEKIKKHKEIVLIVGIGLFLAITAVIGIYQEGDPVNYAQAATTANVTVSATVAQSEELTISAVNADVAINGSTTTVTSTADVNLGALTTGANSIAAQTLTMTTNAGSGYTVNVKYDHELRRTSATTTDIDDHSGTNASPSAFSAPATEAFGYTTEDYSLSAAGDGADRFTGGDWAGFTDSDAEVAYHTGAVNATTTKVGYQAGISGITGAGDDYGCTVTYTMASSF